MLFHCYSLKQLIITMTLLRFCLFTLSAPLDAFREVNISEPKITAKALILIFLLFLRNHDKAPQGTWHINGYNGRQYSQLVSKQPSTAVCHLSPASHPIVQYWYKKGYDCYEQWCLAFMNNLFYFLKVELL